MRRRLAILSWGLLCLALVALSLPGTASTGLSPSSSPPALVASSSLQVAADTALSSDRHIKVLAEKPAARRAPTRMIPAGPPPPHTGFVPPPIDLSHLKGDRIPAKVRAASLPSRLDWREAGAVSPVKNQGACGACYAFAAIGGFESKLLMDGAGTFDFSENQAKECNWEELNDFEDPPGNLWGSCDGGNTLMMANLFSQKGPVLESCDPYVASDVQCNNSCSYQKTALDWRVINGDIVPHPDVLKAYIETYGPVHTSMYVGRWNREDWRKEFSNYDGSYTLYHPGTEGPNHGVLIVGWDDDLVHAGGTGGWIVKNSWGTDWGGTCGYGNQRGYFTIAYGSASIGMHSAFIYDWQDYDPSGGLMHYDEAGLNSYVGCLGSTTAWGLGKLFPPRNTYITRVEFWTTDVTTDVDVYVYDSFDGNTPHNLLWSRENLSYNEAGYHSVPVNPPLPVTSGDDVVAVAKFTNASLKYPVAMDERGPHESQRTYLSCSGTDGSWEDAGARFQGDVGIRLRTSDAGGPPTPTPSPTATGTTTSTPTPTSKPFTPVAWVHLPIILRNYAPSVAATSTPTSTRTSLPGPTSTPTEPGVTATATSSPMPTLTPTTPPASTGVVPLPGQPHSLDIVPSNGRLYVARFETRDVAVLDLYDLAWIGNVPLPEGPKVVRVNPELGRAYASYGNPLYVISSANNMVLGQIADGAYNPSELAVNPSNHRLYIADWTTVVGRQDKVQIYDGNTNVRINTLDLGVSSFVENVAVAVNRNTGMAYAAYTGDERIAVIDTHSQISSRITPSSMAAPPSDPWIAVNAVTNRLYLRGRNQTVVIDLSTNTEIGALDEDGRIAVDDIRNIVYVHQGSRVHVYNGANNTKLREIPLDKYRYVTDIACDAGTRRILLAAPNDDEIVVVADNE